MASEYPVMVDLFYTDIYGKDLHWYAGFLLAWTCRRHPYPEPDVERVPLGVWYTYESPNLFELSKSTAARIHQRHDLRHPATTTTARNRRRPDRPVAGIAHRSQECRD